MRRYLLFALALAGSLLIVGTVWQTVRYATLAADARRIELREQDWFDENRKLAAGIAVLSSRSRAEAMAASLGLEKVDPAHRLRIVLSAGGTASGPGKSSGGSDG